MIQNPVLKVIEPTSRFPGLPIVLRRNPVSNQRPAQPLIPRYAKLRSKQARATQTHHAS